MAAFEGIGVATVMPVIAADLDGLRWYAWSFSAFIVASLYGMVWGGEAADRHGPRRPLTAALACFAGGLVLGGLAPALPVFVAARALQGLGSGIGIVAVYVLVARAYPEELRPRVFSALAAAWVVPAIVGPAVAGTLADTVGWRWVFLGVLVVVPACVGLVLPSLRQHGGPLPAELASSPRSGRRRRALVVAVAATALQYGALRTDAVGAAVAVGAAAVMVAALPPLLPGGTFRLARGLPAAVGLRAVMAGAFFGAETFVPLMLTSVTGLSTAQAGLALTCGALGWASGSWAQGHGDRISRSGLVRLGSTLVALGIGGLAVGSGAAAPAASLVACWALAAFGMGLTIPSFSVVVLGESAPGDQGFNSAALQVSDALGGMVLIGATGVWFAAVTTAGDPQAGVFTAIFAAMALVAAAGAAVGGRVAPRHAGATSAVAG
jgi:MFS family permease